jgi:hypothetical protein
MAAPENPPRPHEISLLSWIQGFLVILRFALCLLQPQSHEVVRQFFASPFPGKRLFPILLGHCHSGHAVQFTPPLYWHSTEHSN